MAEQEFLSQHFRTAFLDEFQRFFLHPIAVNDVVALWGDIQTRYEEPQRHYHTLKHIFELVQFYEKYQASFPSAEDKFIVYISILYHDIIYDPKSKTNEEDSIIFMKDSLKPFLSDSLIHQISYFIQCTKSHKIDLEEAKKNQINSFCLSLFMDLDLLILGSARTRYQEYMQQIRQEYCSYSDEQYFQGRLKVLSYFLSSEVVYQNEMIRENYETIARENIQFEIDQLHVKYVTADSLKV
jgi:predicted metal-dependent HD superfamily phosphohydrolase